jgi:DHA1 family inner membrane transport protein
LTLANVLGVPLRTLVGQHYGWRLTFGIIVALVAAALLAIIVLVPQVAPVGAENLRHLAGCTAGSSGPRLPGREMIFGLWA